MTGTLAGNPVFEDDAKVITTSCQDSPTPSPSPPENGSLDVKEWKDYVDSRMQKMLDSLKEDMEKMVVTAIGEEMNAQLEDRLQSVGSDLQEVRQNIDVINCRVVRVEAKAEECMQKNSLAKREHALLKECLSGALQLMENFAATSSESLNVSTISKSQERLEDRIKHMESTLTSSGMMKEPECMKKSSSAASVLAQPSVAELPRAQLSGVPIPDLRDAVNELTMKINGQISGKKQLQEKSKQVEEKSQEKSLVPKSLESSWKSIANGEVNVQALRDADARRPPSIPPAIHLNLRDPDTLSNRSGHSGIRIAFKDAETSSSTRCISPTESFNASDRGKGSQSTTESITASDRGKGSQADEQSPTNHLQPSPTNHLQTCASAGTLTPDAHHVQPGWKRPPGSSASPRRVSPVPDLRPHSRQLGAPFLGKGGGSLTVSTHSPASRPLSVEPQKLSYQLSLGGQLKNSRSTLPANYAWSPPQSYSSGHVRGIEFSSSIRNRS